MIPINLQEQQQELQQAQEPPENRHGKIPKKKGGEPHETLAGLFALGAAAAVVAVLFFSLVFAALLLLFPPLLAGERG